MGNRGYSAIGLVQPKWDCNVGGVLRAARCYGAALVVIEGDRFSRQGADTTKAWRHMPVLRQESVLDGVPYSCVPVAVELTNDARCITTFTHPERAFYIFGPEDGSVPRRVLDKCVHIVKVPTSFCMNLAATVNVVLYDRIAKEAKQ